MVNKVTLIGRLGKDPEIRAFEGNRKVANFTLATNERYTDKSGNKQEITDWHNLAIWGAQAEIAEKFLKKGMLIYIEGRLKSRSREDKDGVKKYTTEVVVDSFKMLEGRKDGDTSPNGSDHAPGQEIADDLPF
ncbi:MAG: single-stranded DNA-binding protein [Bacteroidota bacterium]